MRIKRNDGRYTVLLSDMEAGTVFDMDDCLYMRIRGCEIPVDRTSPYSVVRLHDGEYMEFVNEAYHVVGGAFVEGA